MMVVQGRVVLARYVEVRSTEGNLAKGRRAVERPMQARLVVERVVLATVHLEISATTVLACAQSVHCDHHPMLVHQATYYRMAQSSRLNITTNPATKALKDPVTTPMEDHLVTPTH